MLVNSYFSHSQNIQEIILSELGLAQRSVQVAVAWFTNQVLFDKLLTLQNGGVSVSLIITKHDINDESSLSYSDLVDAGGFFSEVENDTGFMHNKFCVIDNHTTINGSYNWTYKANKSNQENITVISNDPKTANEFLNAFSELKNLTGITEESIEELELSKTLRFLTLIKTFISLGETNNIYQYLSELRTRDDMNPIIDALTSRDFTAASELISSFEKGHSQLINVSAAEKAYLSYQITLISHQIEFLDIEKAEIEGLIARFNHRCAIELNPLVLRVLEMKKKIYQKLKDRGLVDDTYEELDEEFRSKNEEYEREVEIEIPELNTAEKDDIKKAYREGVKLCHPDSPSCIYEDKKEAAAAFEALTEAFKKNDIQSVQFILAELQLGNSINGIDGNSELQFLRSKFESLKAKLTILLAELQKLKADERYCEIQEISDWDEYFESQISSLQRQLEDLNAEFAKP